MPFHSNPMPLGAVDDRAKQFMVAMRDGTRLASDLYLPSGYNASSSAKPVVLIRTMYDKAGPLTFIPIIADYLNDQGYPVVAQDVRGKGMSEGMFDLMSGVLDGYDTLDWLAAQPWARGGITMFGESYPAYAAWEAVASGHPALRAIGARCISTSLGEQFHGGGAFNLAVVAMWAAQTLDKRIYLYDLPIDYDVRPLSSLLPSWLGGHEVPLWDDLIKPPGDRFWRHPNIEAVRADKIRVPMMHIGGWWDEWRGPQMRDWRIARRSTDAPQYLRMEIADHQGGRLIGDDEPVINLLDTEEGIREMMPRYLGGFVDFLRHELGDGTAAAPSLVQIEVAEGGIWQGETWPPPSARPLRLHLAGGKRAKNGPDGGALAASADRDAHIASWIHDPQDLVPMLSTDPLRALSERLPDEREVEKRDDVLTFTTDPVSEPMDLMGPVRATLQVAADAPVIQVTAKLVDVFPNGRARRITEGVRQIERPFPGDPVVVDLLEVGYRIKPRHRLRLEVAASCFPRWQPVIDPFGGDSWSAVTGQQVEYRLTTGGSALSHLDLVVASEALS